MKRLPLILSLLMTVNLSGWIMAADPTTLSVPADEALNRLKAGNERFAQSKVSAGQPVAERRAATAKAQHPFAIIVGCADSRTSPEIIFDQGIGDLFVVRTAGNLVDDYALGSIEYAVEHLGTRLIVVLGHERCGAVQAALAGGSAPGHIEALVRAIQPAVAASKEMKGDPLTNAVHENDAEVAATIRKRAELGELASQVRIVEGYYDLDTGKVEWAAK
jgi:carbonic anhydrase